jgi:hypothetical protein
MINNLFLFKKLINSNFFGLPIKAKFWIFRDISCEFFFPTTKAGPTTTYGGYKTTTTSEDSPGCISILRQQA